MDAARPSGQNPVAVPTTLLRSRGVAAAAAAAAVALLAAGCGGGGGGAKAAYSADGTKACLEKAGVSIVAVDESSDLVAASALGGAVAAQLAQNRVTIAFGRDDAEGQVIEKAYTQYGSNDVPIDQVLQRKRNAVLLWAGAPTVQDADAVRSCLKG